MTKEFFFSYTAVSILVVSNHNSFRVLFGKIASLYFFEKYINILALEILAQETGTVPVVSAHFRSPLIDTTAASDVIASSCAGYSAAVASYWLRNVLDV